MNFDVGKAAEQIVNNPHFLKLKKIIENNSYHDHESVFDHSIKSYKFAQKEIKGSFIKNEEAKMAFDSYISVRVDGVEKRDLMQILALVHDIGKTTVFEIDGKQKSIVETLPNGETFTPYHDYWGSLIVKDVVDGVGFSDEQIWYLSNCIRIHGTFNSVWKENGDKNATEILEILKKASEGCHVEQIFNGYCDCYSAKPFKDAISLIHGLLNMPETYEEVKFSF